MGPMTSPITSLTIAYSTVYSGTDQRKHQSSASPAFVQGIHRWPVNSPHKGASDAENVSIWWRHHDHRSPSLTYVWKLLILRLRQNLPGANELKQWTGCHKQLWSTMVPIIDVLVIIIEYRSIEVSAGWWIFRSNISIPKCSIIVLCPSLYSCNDVLVYVCINIHIYIYIYIHTNIHGTTKNGCHISMG